MTTGKDTLRLLAAACAPYRHGQALYVRETWTKENDNYEYKADVEAGYGPFCANCTLDICAGDCNSALIWRPSIHMPREAARLFLRVTNVSVAKLQDMNDDDALKEGCGVWGDVDWVKFPLQDFIRVWDSTVKPADRALYGWEANPWCWVIEFERIRKEEREKNVNK